MRKDDRIVIIGAGIFGLSTACELAREGYHNIVVLDRHLPPVRVFSGLRLETTALTMRVGS